MNPFFRRSGLLVTLSMLLVFAVACGTEETSENVSSESENGNADNGTANEVNEDAEANDQASAELEGSVVIDGSGTVYPFMAKAAEDYMTEEAENVSVEVSRSGTSAGFEKFLTEGGTDFNDASREIKDEETEKAEELGMEVKEFQVALDGLTFVINKENDWATELTQEEIIDIFLASGDKQNWSDVRPEFPDEEINTYGPNENHGTYEFMF
jgi:phosphate transport system substrate-binding protein